MSSESEAPYGTRFLHCSGSRRRIGIPVLHSLWTWRLKSIVTLRCPYLDCSSPLVVVCLRNSMTSASTRTYMIAVCWLYSPFPVSTTHLSGPPYLIHLWEVYLYTVYIHVMSLHVVAY